MSNLLLPYLLPYLAVGFEAALDHPETSTGFLDFALIKHISLLLLIQTYSRKLKRVLSDPDGAAVSRVRSYSIFGIPLK